MISKNITNQSFNAMRMRLQDLNYENFAFLLDTKDSKLKNFKLEDLETSKNQNRDIHEKFLHTTIEECRNNIWFYFREIVRIPEVFRASDEYYSTPVSQFILNIESFAMIYMYSKGINFIVSPRIERKGITTTLVLLEIYDRYIMNDTIHYDNGISTYIEKSDVPSYYIDNFRTRLIYKNNSLNEKNMLNSEAMIHMSENVHITSPENNYANNLYSNIKNENLKKEFLYINGMSNSTMPLIIDSLSQHFLKPNSNLYGEISCDRTVPSINLFNNGLLSIQETTNNNYSTGYKNLIKIINEYLFDYIPIYKENNGSLLNLLEKTEELQNSDKIVII